MKQVLVLSFFIMFTSGFFQVFAQEGLCRCTWEGGGTQVAQFQTKDTCSISGPENFSVRPLRCDWIEEEDR